MPIDRDASTTIGRASRRRDERASSGVASSSRDADDDSGRRAMGSAVARRAGGGTDGSGVAPARERARRQRARRGDARDHAARARNWSSRTSGSSPWPAPSSRSSLDGRPAPSHAPFIVVGRSRACGSARGGAARARISRCRGGIAVPPDARQPSDASGQRDGRRRRPRARRRAIGCRSAIAVASAASALGAAERRRGAAGPPRDASACCRARRSTTSRADALDVLQSAPYTIGAAIRIAWASGSRARG